MSPKQRAATYEAWDFLKDIERDDKNRDFFTPSQCDRLAACRTKLKAALAEAEAYDTEVPEPVTAVLTSEPEPQRDYRKELWVGVAIAVARAESALETARPGQWADRALADFDKTFGGGK